VGSTAIKRMTFVVSAFFTGLMGAVVALQQVSIDPTSMFGLTWTINMIVMVIVGGIATALGPIVGVLIVYFAIQKPLQGSDNLSLIITGVLLVALVRFAPEGLVGAARQLLQGLRSRVHRWRAAPGVSVGSP
jgi:branched-chain amino acid transport system permease protein